MRRGVLGLGLWLALAVLAPLPMAGAGVDLRDVRPIGVAGSDTAELAAVGDVNGDGVQDVAVGLQDDPRTRDVTALDEVGVVGFGLAPPDPSRPGFSGLVASHLNEPALFDDRGRVNLGQAVGGDVVGLGDWDGDGLDDVAFGAMGAGPHGRPNAGSVYVVLGRREPGTIDVRTDPRVVRIDGPARASKIGSTLGAAGDFDGDGRPDLAIALPGERAVVVRGGARPRTTIDLARPPAGSTILLRGLDAGRSARPDARDRREPQPSMASFAAVGDIDGDARGELAVGVPAADVLRGRGRAFVVRGAAAGSVVDISDRRALVARVVGPRVRPGFAANVAAMPDVDGDGHAEWVIGAGEPDGVLSVGGEPPAGAFVVFSRARGEIRPDRAGQPVVNIDATGRGPRAGRAVAGIPDATGDGVADLLIGAPDASPFCRSNAGAIALVPGRRTPGRVRLGARSPRVDGPSVRAEIGKSIAISTSELFLGARPFEKAAQLDLWRLPLTALAGLSPALPEASDCLSVAVEKRSRRQLRRAGSLRVVVRSDAGDGQAHRLRVQVEVLAGRTIRRGRARVVALRRAGRRRLTLRLPRGARELLARRTTVTVAVTAEQRVGSSHRTSSGAFSGDAITFRVR